jgi:hypothetical protein
MFRHVEYLYVICSCPAQHMRQAYKATGVRRHLGQSRSHHINHGGHAPVGDDRWLFRLSATRQHDATSEVMLIPRRKCLSPSPPAFLLPGGRPGWYLPSAVIVRRSGSRATGKERRWCASALLSGALA